MTRRSPASSLRQQQRKLAITGRAANQAHPGSALENPLALLLRHAAEDADDFAGVAAKIILGIEEAETREDLVRGFFADAAGIVENQAGFVGRDDLAIAAAQEHAGDLFGIVIVHLAAKRLDVEGPSRRIQRGGRRRKKRIERNVDRF